MKHILTIISRVCHCEADGHRLKQSLFLATMIISLLFLPLHVSAQTKEIIAEGTYNMGDGETPSVAESRALLQAKRTALEQAGTYVESYSKVKNFQLTEDEIKVITSGLISLRVNSPQLAA